MLLPQIEKIAAQVRKQFENHSINDSLLIKLYSKYNPRVKDVGLFVEKANELFPKLNCGLATVYLKEKLKMGKIVNGKYGNQNHTFLVIDEGLEEVKVIDITSDQYGGPGVYVGPILSPWTH